MRWWLRKQIINFLSAGMNRMTRVINKIHNKLLDCFILGNSQLTENSNLSINIILSTFHLHAFVLTHLYLNSHFFIKSKHRLCKDIIFYSLYILYITRNLNKAVFLLKYCLTVSNNTFIPFLFLFVYRAFSLLMKNIGKDTSVNLFE